VPTPHTQQPVLAQPSHITLENKVDSVEHLQCSFGCRISVRRHAAVRRPGKQVLLSLSLYYMYTRDNGVPIGLFRQFGLDLQTCFDVMAVRSEVQTQG